MFSVEASLENVSSWGEKNVVKFNSLKIQVCALTTAKKIHLSYRQSFKTFPLYPESKAKLASKKLGVINRARRFFTPKHWPYIGPRFGLIWSTKISSTPPGNTTWQSTSVRFHKNFLSSATELWNGLTAAVFPGNYNDF